MGKSGFIAQKIAQTLVSTGTKAFYLNPTDALHGDLGLLSRGDLVVTVSKSGSTEELLRLVPFAKVGALCCLMQHAPCKGLCQASHLERGMAGGGCTPSWQHRPQTAAIVSHALTISSAVPVIMACQIKGMQRLQHKISFPMSCRDIPSAGMGAFHTPNWLLVASDVAPKGLPAWVVHNLVGSAVLQRHQPLRP